ncbi:MAG: glutathione S-transferase family protein [Pseudomonadota bacterium]
MYTLYFAPDNASLVVRIALEEIGARYNTWLVDRRSNEQLSDEYRRLNPSGLIPVCIIDGEPVFETAAILLCLAERHERLAPPLGSAKRPTFLKWLFFLSNTLHPDLRQLFYPKKYIGPDSKLITTHARMTRERLHKHFTVLDDMYGELKTAYLLGDQPTIVDIYAAMCLRWPQLYPPGEPSAFVHSQYPALQKMLKTMQTRPALVRAFEAEGIPAPYLVDVQPPDGSVGVAL